MGNDRLALGVAILLVGLLAGPATAGDTVYVVTTFDTLIGIDVETGAFVAQVPVGRQPRQVTIAPGRGTLYTCNNESDDVSVVDLDTHQVVASIPVGDGPYGMALGAMGRYLYVVNYWSQDLAVVDLTTRAVVARISFPASPHRVAVHPDGSRVYVTLTTGSTVVEISTATWTIARTITLDRPFGLAVAPDGSRLYVTDLIWNLLLVYDPTTLTEITRYQLENKPSNILITPDGRQLWVTDYGANQIAAVDLSNGALLAQLATHEGPFELTLNGLGDRLYVANLLARDISVVDRRELRILGTLWVGQTLNGIRTRTNIDEVVEEVRTEFVALLRAMADDPSYPEDMHRHLVGALRAVVGDESTRHDDTGGALPAYDRNDLDRALRELRAAARHLEHALFLGVDVTVIAEGLTRLAGTWVTQAISESEAILGSSAEVIEAWATVDLANGHLLNTEYALAIHTYRSAYRAARRAELAATAPAREGRVREADDDGDRDEDHDGDRHEARDGDRDEDHDGDRHEARDGDRKGRGPGSGKRS